VSKGRAVSTVVEVPSCRVPSERVIGDAHVHGCPPAGGTL
jgi:hypothetical protein